MVELTWTEFIYFSVGGNFNHFISINEFIFWVVMLYYRIAFTLPGPLLSVFILFIKIKKRKANITARQIYLFFPDTEHIRYFYCSRIFLSCTYIEFLFSHLCIVLLYTFSLYVWYRHKSLTLIYVHTKTLTHCTCKYKRKL